jgi:hypothetical protein
MAGQEPGFGFTGSLHNISACKRRDMDTIIIRSKGGPSKRMIQSKPSFELTRRNNKEFGGRSTASMCIRRALHPLKPLFDYNISAPLNSALKPIQQMDTVSELGKRNIRLSRNPRLLEGFQLNRRNPFESVLRSPLSFTLSKDELKATLEIPELIPGNNFFPVAQYPVYRWQAALGVIPDIFFDETRGYLPNGNLNGLYPFRFETEWCAVKTGAASRVIGLSLPNAVPAGSSFSLMLAAGISFGTLRSAGPEQARYAGSGKILMVR